MLGKLSLIHCVKLCQPFVRHSRDQQVSAYNHSFFSIIQSHGCKEILFSLLHANKIADAVLLYVFNIRFPASLLGPVPNSDQTWFVTQIELWQNLKFQDESNCKEDSNCEGRSIATNWIVTKVKIVTNIFQRTTWQLDKFKQWTQSSLLRSCNA